MQKGTNSVSNADRFYLDFKVLHGNNHSCNYNVYCSDIRTGVKTTQYA
jgi:hypothetical protein